ncbi:MAG: anti-sigma factor [Tepidisphaera sp.]|nr:anti-sigma factor [Tepidisphaera sp.]
MSEHEKHHVMDDLLQGLFDDELDPKTAHQVRVHVSTCEQCAARLAAREQLRAALQSQPLRRPAPPALAANILVSLPDEHATPQTSPQPTPITRAPRWAFAALAACFIFAFATLWLATSQAPYRLSGTSEVVSAHIRSLMASHLADVATSDQHTVKPWFAGKLDFSPPVTDFADKGFPLTGGRLDYLADQPAAAIVYTHRKHIINFFVTPVAARASAGIKAPALTEDRGYHTIAWSDGAMRYWLVSDLNPNELADLARLLGAPM